MTTIYYSVNEMARQAGFTSPSTWTRIKNDLRAPDAVMVSKIQGAGWTLDSWEDAANNELHTRREPLMKAITRLRLEEEALRQEYGVTDQDEPADQKAEG